MAARRESQSGSWQFIQEELSCGICHELLTRPKVVPCKGKHSFCQHCLEKWATTQQPFRCPTCRQPANLPAKGVPSLPDCDRRIVNLCDQLRNQGVSELNYCCSVHDDEEFRVFCKQCKVPVCETCLEEAHDGHPTTTLRRASQERTPTVQALLDEGKDILETYGSFVQGFGATEKLLTEQKHETETNIFAAFDRTIQNLTKAKEGLMSQVDSMHKQNLDDIQDQKAGVLAKVAELSRVCENAYQEIRQGGSNLFQHEALLLSTVGKYKDRLSGMPKQPQVAVFSPADDHNIDVTSTKGYIFAQSFAIPSFAIPEPPVRIDAEVAGDHHGYECEHPCMAVTFGGKGAEEGKFDRPRGVAVSEEGQIFVADYINARIQAFTIDGMFVNKFPTTTSGGQKIFPYDVAMDGEGNLWVVGHTESQTDYCAVQFSKDHGRVLKEISLAHTGLIRGIAVHPTTNHILITQTSSDLWQFEGELQVYTPDGALLRTVGRQQGMEYPQYASVDREGNVLVSDFKDHYVYKYNEREQLLVKFGGEGKGQGQLSNPCGVCSDDSGNIIVADSGNGRVEMFDKRGVFVRHVAMGMTRPCAVAMATAGQLVVTDTEDNTVSVIQDVQHEN
ncbi:tripartite motif-containing protein 3-like [Branchiostoma floridae]|uniref:Tripartite motif-containing protein 3-like n=1 Tax=Branchiostoma floridae TaxID=7739 RepID=A0A9J7MIL7_BRAFL|nr:tripartite motif-containing protein 3-like [Branchiostoma floridae]